MKTNGFLALLYNACFVGFIAVPLVAVVLVSFTDKAYMSMPFDGASLRWYRALLDAPEFLNAFRTSMELGLISATLSLILSLPAAIALTRWNFRGKESFNAALMSPLLIPHVVLGVAFLRFFTDVGLSGTFAGMVFAHIIIIMPYALRMCLSSADGIDPSLENAAVSLGATKFTVFWRITLRLILPGVVSGWVLAFIHSFDEVTMSTFIASPSLTPLPVMLYHKIEDSIDPMVASISALLIFGAVVLMLIIDRLYGLDRIFVGKR